MSLLFQYMDDAASAAFSDVARERLETL